ncbi:HAD family hydrolase [Cellulomonas sp. ATA003]|uniref:HAD family hydrolase n=1 Tax=Cellulomonas sp. ATA003 TaxID=3073064 RepID=UPI0028733897|nr:HAD family hydrolase [Cellulomonas sp. ATA003]WNB84670.1 HAD family hydrolase [Cellulomonas sp. ATA003]
MSDLGVDGVLFDIDDTLVDTRGAFGSALGVVARRYLSDLPEGRYPELLVHWRADVENHYGRYTRGEATYREQRMARANLMHASFGGDVLDDAAYDAWDAVYEDAFQAAWAAHDDAAPVVKELLAAGLAVGALSNAATDYQSLKLGRAGLADSVPMLVGVDTLGFGKPDPRVFVEACRRLGTDPARTVYVGDELDVDAVAARRAGLTGVWLDRPGPRRVPVSEAEVAAAGVVVIRGLDELPGVLDGRVAP